MVPTNFKIIGIISMCDGKFFIVQIQPAKKTAERISTGDRDGLQFMEMLKALKRQVRVRIFIIYAPIRFRFFGSRM